MDWIEYRALSITRKSALMPMSSRSDEHRLERIRLQAAQTNQGADRIAELEIALHQQPR